MPLLKENWSAGLPGHVAEHSEIGVQVNRHTRQLAPGTAGTVLTANPAATDGMEWLTPSGGGSGATADKLGRVFIDDQSGTDTQKVAAAIAVVQGQSYRGTITFGNRNHDLPVQNLAPITGLRFSGPPGVGNSERNGQTLMPCRLSLSGTGGFLQMQGATDIFGVFLDGIHVTGGSNTRLLDQGVSSALWRNLCIPTISCSGLRNLLGSFSAKLLVTAPLFPGPWNIGNCFDTAIHIGASDGVALWPAGMLLDSGTSFNSSGGSVGHPHLMFDFMEKTDVGPIYMTSEGAWGGIQVVGPGYNTGGSNLGGPITFHGGFWEGRNAGAPCNGSLFRQDGGLVNLRDVWIAYGMANPAAQAHTPTDAGILHLRGNGRTLVDGCTYDHATAVAETVPFAFLEGNARLRIRDQWVGSKGGVWTGLPRIGPAGIGSFVDADNSVTVL